jgi:type IV secretory pathway VirB2 component (pilin)
MATILELMTAVVLSFALARVRMSRARKGTTTPARDTSLSRGTSRTPLDYVLAVVIVAAVGVMASFGATGL